MIQYYSAYVPVHRFNSISSSLLLVVTILNCIISLPSDFFWNQPFIITPLLILLLTNIISCLLGSFSRLFICFHPPCAYSQFSPDSNIQRNQLTKNCNTTMPPTFIFKTFKPLAADAVHEMSANDLQALLKEYFGWNPELAWRTRTFLYHVEFTINLSPLTVELCAPDLLKVFLARYMLGGHLNFIQCIRKFLNIEIKPIFVDDQLLKQTPQAIKMATFIFWNLRAALKCSRPYDHFIIHHREDRRFACTFDDWDATPVGHSEFVYRFLLPRWRLHWAVGPYYGNDRRRIFASLAITALRRAYNKNADRLRKRCRLERARLRLDIYYERSRLVIDQRINGCNLRMERTARRIQRLENYICPN